MSEPGLEEALKIVTSPKFNTNPTQRLVDETLVRVIYPIIATAVRDANGGDALKEALKDASGEEPPRMLGTANIAVVDYWRSRALQAECDVTRLRRLLDVSAPQKSAPVTATTRKSLNAGNARPAQRRVDPYIC